MSASKVASPQQVPPDALEPDYHHARTMVPQPGRPLSLLASQLSSRLATDSLENGLLRDFCGPDSIL